jgi:hypothetical protein
VADGRPAERLMAQMLKSEGLHRSLLPQVLDS